ncbi:hypothetical protein D3C81_2176680 [compost metagenome]
MAFVQGVVFVGDSWFGIKYIYDFGQAREETLNIIDNNADVAHRVGHGPDQ